MGFWDNIKKTLNECAEEGKETSSLIQKWQAEEKEYINASLSSRFNFETLSDIINTASLQLQRESIKLQIKQNDNSPDEIKDARRDLSSLKNEIDNSVNNLKRKLKFGAVTQKDIDVSEDLLGVDRANAYREQRVALCVSYLLNPKATQHGKADAEFILGLSPFVSNLDLETKFLERRISVYQKNFNGLNCSCSGELSAKSFENLSALDICFYSNLFTKTEILWHDMQNWEKAFDDSANLRKRLQYYDEFYYTHFGNPSFYGMTMKYDEHIRNFEKNFWIYINEKMNEFND